MLVVRVYEDQLQFSDVRNLFDMASVFAGMHPDPARQMGDKPRNLEANGLGWIGKAAWV
jgi:hypothetical protein